MKNKEEKINLQPSHVKVFNFIKVYIEKKIVSPELSEISKNVKLSTRQVHRLVDELVVLKFLSRDYHKKRSIKILKLLE